MSTNFNTASFHSIPESLQHLLNDLNFVSTVGPYMKIDFKNRKHVNNSFSINDLKNWFNRSQAGQSRESLILQLNSLVNRCIQEYNQHINNNEIQTLLINKLMNLLKGIENLRLTYQDDPEILAKLLTIHQNIAFQIRRNGNLVEDPMSLGLNNICSTTPPNINNFLQPSSNSPPVLTSPINIVLNNNDNNDKNSYESPRTFTPSELSFLEQE